MIRGLLRVETPTNFGWVQWVRLSGDTPEHIVISCWRNACARLRSRTTHHAIGVWRCTSRTNSFFEDLRLARAQLCIHIIELIRLCSCCHILAALPDGHHVSAHDCIIWALGGSIRATLPLLLIHWTLQHRLLLLLKVLLLLLLLVESVVIIVRLLLLHLHCHHVWRGAASDVLSTALALLLLILLLIHAHLLLLVSLVSHLV